MRKRLNVTSAWHSRKSRTVTELEPKPSPLELPADAFALAALHRRLVNDHRHKDAKLALDRLCEMARKPIPVEQVHQFVDREQLPSIAAPE